MGRKRNSRPLGFESLEARQMLNGTPAFSERTVDNQDSAFAEIGTGWTDGPSGVGVNGNSRQHAEGVGDSKAQYGFSDLAPGSYDVRVEWIPGTDRATNATYRITDGVNTLGTVSVDQTVAASGVFDGTTWWQSLGRYQTATGTLAVELSDNANGVVSADAVRLASFEPMILHYDAANNCWYNPFTGQYTAWVDGAQAVFAGTGSTITLSDSISASKITFSGGNFTLQSGQINLPAYTDTTIEVASGATATISSTIAGAGGLTKAGAGSLVLSGANTFTGGVTINDSGVLQVGSAGALNATAPNAVTFGSGSTGVLRLAGNSITLSGLATADTASTAAVENGSSAAATLTVIGTTDSTFAGILRKGSTGNLSLTKAGTGSLTLTGNSSTSLGGNVTVTAGNLTLANGGRLACAMGAIDGSGTCVTVTGANSQWIASSTLTVGNNTSNNSLTVSAGGSVTATGNLTIGYASGANNNSVTVTGAGSSLTSGSTLNVGRQGSYNSLTVAAGAAASGYLFYLSGGPGNPAGAANNAVTVTGTGSTLNVGSSWDLADRGTGNQFNVLSGGVANMGGMGYVGWYGGSACAITIDGTGSSWNTGNIDYGNGTSSLTATVGSGGTWNAAGTVTVKNGNAISLNGGTLNANSVNLSSAAARLNFSGGTLAAKAAGTLVSGSGQIALVGSGNISTNFTTTIASVISGSGSLVKSGSGTLALTAANTFAGGTTIASGTLQIGSGGTAGSIVGNVVDNGTLVFNRSDNIAFAGIISGSGRVTKQGAGSLALTGENTFADVLTISAGTVSIGNGGAAGSITANVVNNTNLTFNHANDIAYAGVIAGSGSLTKLGGGTLTLSGANNSTGITTISAGALQIGNGGAAGSIVGNVVNNANLTFNRSDAIAYAGVISGSGSVTKIGDGMLTLAGNNTFTGGTTVSAGGLSISSLSDTAGVASNLGTSGTIIIDDSTFQYTGSGAVSTARFYNGYGGDPWGVTTIDITQASGSLTLNGGYAYNQRLTKAGAGTLVLGGQNPLGFGHASVDAGTLVLAARITNAAWYSTIEAVDDVKFGATLKFGKYTDGNYYDGQILAIAGDPARKVHMSGGTLDLNGDTINVVPVIDGTGVITNSAAGTTAMLTVLVNYDKTFSGVIQDGAGQVAVRIATTAHTGSVPTNTIWTLTGVNTYTGGTTVARDTIQLGDGGTANSLCSAVNVERNSKLSGDGTTGALSVDGVVSPGIGGVGVIETGDLTLSASSHYLVDMTDDGCDQLDVTGTVSLGNATLDITNTRAEVGDDVLVLIKNDGTDVVVGRFANLSEGAEVDFGRSRYAISYRYNAETGESGTGNDVALIRPAAPIGLAAAAASGNQIDLTWTDNSALDTGYEIERMTEGSVWTPIGTVEAGETSYHDSGLSEGTAYYYRVWTTLGSCRSEHGEMAYAVTLPAAPTNMAVTFVDGGQAHLTWQDQSSVEAGYSIEQLIDGNWQQLQTTDAGVESLAVAATFTPSTEYSFRVRAYEHGFSDDPLYSLVSETTTTTAAWPAAPTGLDAMAASDSRINLTWTDNATDETGYRIERSTDGSSWTEIGTTTADNYSDESVTEGEGTLRYYRVLATNSAGDSAYASAAGATTLPAAPTDCVTVLVDGSQVNLTWNNHSEIATGSSIEQLLTDGVTWLEIQTSAADATSATIQGTFEPSLSYTFRVRAYQESGDPDAPSYTYSLASNEAMATAPAWPAAPTALNATAASDTQIDLTWTDNDISQTGYKIDRSTDGTTWQLLTTITDPDIKSYSDTGLTEGTPYYYRVQAWNLVGVSGYSMNAAAPLLAMPTGVEVTAIRGSAVELEWADNSAGESGYSIQQLVGGDWQEIGWTEPNATSATVEGVFEPSTEYSFRVQAWSDWSNSVESDIAVADPVVWPATPTDLTATAVSGTEVLLSWTASTGATSYSIERANGEDGNWSTIGTVDAPQTTFSAIGLSPAGTEYSFRVAAANGAGSSAFAASLPIPTQNQSPTVGNPSAGANQVTGITTTLSAIGADDGGEGALTYSWSVVSAPTGGDAWFGGNDSNDAKTTAVTFCTAGEYAFRVTVTDASGASVASSTLNVTVSQTLTAIAVTPGDEAVLQGDTRQFIAVGIDQFGNKMPLTDVAWSLGGGVGSIDSTSGLYTAPTSGDDTSFTITASSGGISGAANVAFKKKAIDDNPIAQEFAIGASGVFNVPSDATSLYLGFHDFYEWDNNWGSVDVQLAWNTGETISQSVEATANLYNAFAPSGPFGPAQYKDSPIDSDSPTGQSIYRPVQVSVPTGATSVMVVAYGTWGNDPNHNISSGPEGQSGSDFTQYIYRTPLLHSANIDRCSAGLGTLVGLWGSEKSKLLKLTVADHSQTANSATAIDAAIRDLYLAEDPATEGVSVDISSVIDALTANAAKDTRLTITRSDGRVFLDDDLTKGGSLKDRLLSVTDQARDFVVTMWVDSDHDRKVSSGEEKEEVDVHVVKPWTDLGTWTNYEATAKFVKANADGASLQQLAVNITGNASDAKLLGAVGKVTRDKQIDVTPLLTILESRIRRNVVAAANVVNKNAIFGQGNPQVRSFRELQINQVFQPGGGPVPTCDCVSMVLFELSRGLIQELKPGEFDRLKLIPATILQSDDDLIYVKPTALVSVNTGSWLRFRNKRDYDRVQPEGMWAAENVITTKSQRNGDEFSQYYGWGVAKPLTYSEWRQELRDGYNRGLWPWQRIEIEDVPGYDGYERFLDVAKIAQMIFQLRTKT